MRFHQILTNNFFNFFHRKNTYFVDLFVRVSNKIAINMYKNLGYVVYRTVIEYYAGPGDLEEDAYGEYELKRLSTRSLITKKYFHSIDMRKAMPRDVEKKSMIPLKHPVRYDEVE